MTNEDYFALDDCFALMGEDADFIGDLVLGDVPVLTYRWSQSPAIAAIPPADLLQRGHDVMQQLGLIRIRWTGRHLRGDTREGQRVKMTVITAAGESMYLLMTAGLPGTRNQAKAINRRISRFLEAAPRTEPETVTQ